MLKTELVMAVGGFIVGSGLSLCLAFLGVRPWHNLLVSWALITVTFIAAIVFGGLI